MQTLTYGRPPTTKPRKRQRTRRAIPVRRSDVGVQQPALPIPAETATGTAPVAAPAPAVVQDMSAYPCGRCALCIGCYAGSGGTADCA